MVLKPQVLAKIRALMVSRSIFSLNKDVVDEALDADDLFVLS